MDNEIKYTLEDGTEIDDKLLNTTDTTVLEEFEFTGKSGKKYKGEYSVAVTADKTSGKKSTIVKNGKTYRYVRTDVEQTGTVGAKDTTHFNDVTAKATVQGMHKADGSIDYSKIKGRVWLIEEKEDGTYGKFKLIENGVGLTDEKVAELSKEATGTFSQAEVDKLGGMKDTDTVLVYETNTYAAVKKEKHAIHDLLMTWGYSGGYVHAMKNFKSLVDSGKMPGLTKDSSGNIFYKGKKIILPTNMDDSESTDIPPYMSDSTEMDVWRDILLSKDPELQSYLNYFGNSFEVYRDHLFSRWLLKRNVDLSNKITSGDYHDVGLSENDKDRPLSDTHFSELGDFRDNEDTLKTLDRMIDSLYTPETLNELSVYVESLLKVWEEQFGGYDLYNMDATFKPLIEEAKTNNSIEVWKKMMNGLRENFNNPLLRSNVYDDYRHRIETSTEIIEVVDEFLSSLGMSSLSNDRFSGVAQVFNFTETPGFWNKYPKAKAYIDKYGKKAFDENVSQFLVSPAGAHGNSANTNDDGVIYRPYGNGILQNVETFTYHDQVTPLRAYRLNSDKTIIRHVYEEVKKARVTANYYKDGTTEKLADSEILPEQEIGSNYTTSPKVIDPIVKMTKDGDKIITTKTIWTLKEVPSDKDGTVPAGGKEVNYYYVKREEVIEVPKPVEPSLPTRQIEPIAPKDLSPAPTQPQTPTEPNPIENEPRVPVKPNEPTGITPIGEAPVKPIEPLAPTSPVVPTQPVTIAPKEPVTPMEPPKPGAPEPVLPPEAPPVTKPVAPQDPTILPPVPKTPLSPTEPRPLTMEPIEPKAPTKPKGLKELGEEPMKPLAPKAPVPPTLVNKPGIAPVSPMIPQAPMKPGQPSIGDEPKVPSLRKPVEPMKPIAPAEPKQPIAPMMPIAPRKPMGDANDPSAPEYPLNKPTEPIAPVVPRKPNAPTPPMVPSKPSAPGIPVLPTQPSLPKAPEDEPIVPVRPTQPMVPTNPMEPVLPEQPKVPERPQELPTEPVQPRVPNKLPTQPVKPEELLGVPREPVPPKEPTQPLVAPTQPVKPQELPEEPRKPAQPKVLPETGDASLASLGLLAGLSGLGALRRKREK